MLAIVNFDTYAPVAMLSFFIVSIFLDSLPSKAKKKTSIHHVNTGDCSSTTSSEHSPHPSFTQKASVTQLYGLQAVSTGATHEDRPPSWNYQEVILAVKTVTYFSTLLLTAG